jgi:uncharacterized membrane protein YfcA
MSAILLILAAGFAAGALNAIAGGGTFITFPVLVHLGIPPITANATATVAALPGYVGGAWAFRRDIRPEGSLRVGETVAVSLVGGVAGSLLLLVTPAAIFDGVVPWLLLIATALFAFGPWLMSALQRRGVGVAGRLVSFAAIFAVALYGGYFNGGLGILLLACFGLIGYANLAAMNGLKNLLSAALSVISAATFAIAGIVEWREGLIMAVAAALGGYCGAWAARRITRPMLLRAGIVLVGPGDVGAFLRALMPDRRQPRQAAQSEIVLPSRLVDFRQP